jgi:hypothetical protein
MKERLLRNIVRFVLLGYIGGGGGVALTEAQLPDANGESDSGLHLIVAVSGKLSLKRKDWNQYAPAMFGTAVKRGDLLRLENSSKATVVCADLTVHLVSNGPSGVPCDSNKKPVLIYRGERINTTRGYESSRFPLVISPRKTLLLNSRPTLRWTPVVDADTYEVRVRGRNVKWRTEVHSKTEIVYPDDAPALVAGSTYIVEVIANGRSSKKEGVPGLGFKRLKPDEAKAVGEAVQKIRALGLADAPTQLLIAKLYANWDANTDWDLNAEAIELLKELSNTLKEPAVRRELGDLYLKIGLNRLAEERYLHALELSAKAGDIEGQALVYNALGLTYEAIGNKKVSAQQYQSAIELYDKKLGHKQKVEQIQARLAKLKSP